jgi:hypothetical protein
MPSLYHFSMATTEHCHFTEKSQDNWHCYVLLWRYQVFANDVQTASDHDELIISQTLPRASTQVSMLK